MAYTNIWNHSKKSLFLMLIMMVSIFVTSTAFAQEDDSALPTAGAAMKGGAQAGGGGGGGDKTFDFEDDDLTGDRVGPDGVDITADKHGLVGSLINIPKDFNNELVNSVDNI